MTKSKWWQLLVRLDPIKDIKIINTWDLLVRTLGSRPRAFKHLIRSYIKRGDRND